MDRATWRAVSVIFGLILVVAGIFVMGHFGQTDAACGASPTVATAVSPSGNCSFAANGYSVGIAALAVGCVLLVGAFILTLSIPAKE
jgi:hypothetical protein